MVLVFLVLTAFFPALLTAAAAIRYKVSVSWLVIDFFAAFSSIILVTVLQHCMHQFIDTSLNAQTGGIRILFNSIITAALIEEGCKAAAFSLMPLRGMKAAASKNRSMLLLAIFFGFVFSGFEHLSYGIRSPNLWLLRLCTAAILHGTITVFYIRMRQARTKRYALTMFLLAVMLHGVYNIFVSIGGWFMIPATATVGITGLSALRTFTEAPSHTEGP